MKKIIIFLLALSMVFALCGCAKDEPKLQGEYWTNWATFSRVLEFSKDRVEMREYPTDGGSVYERTGSFILSGFELKILWDDGDSTTYEYNPGTDTISRDGVQYTK